MTPDGPGHDTAPGRDTAPGHDTAPGGAPGFEPTPPIRDLVFLGDGRRGALLDRGRVTWLCVPDWDSAPVLAGLLGGGGEFHLVPATGRGTWSGAYEPRSLIWASRWVTTHGELRTREALARPADDHRAVLLHRVAAPEGPQDVEIGLGAPALRDLRRDGAGVWTATVGPLRLRLTVTDPAPVVRPGPDGLRLVARPGPDRPLGVVLELSDRPLPTDPAPPDRLWRGTARAWADDAPDLSGSAAPREAGLAYAVLSGLTGPGGTVAAATLGLPEKSEARRNYDYRYVWVRDQAYAGLAAAVDRPLPLLDRAVGTVARLVLEHGDALAPAYRTDGSPVPPERTLDLPGYPGGSAVAGNWVNQQFQLDALGEALQLFAAAERLDHATDDARRAVRTAVEVIGRRWRAPDAGIWELQDRWWTHSRLSCVAGLRTVASGGPADRATRRAAAELADAVERETTRRCLAPGGWWRRSDTHPDVDASLVLPPVRGALPAGDPRTRATLERVRGTLVEDGYVYRFDHDHDRPLGAAEGAFLLCGLMVALAEQHQGDVPAAVRWFERTRAAAGSPGILAEEFDVGRRQLRGNLPQAFVHALLLETAQRLGA